MLTDITGQFLNYKKGFTLIELAIVLVIVGLLVSGVLMGTELVKQSKIRNVVSLLKEYDTAVATFKAKYNSIPGDFNKAVEFGIGANLAEPQDEPGVFNGNNNGILDSQSTLNDQSNFSWEFKNFFVMLSNASLVKGTFSQATPNTTIDIAFPSIATGGGMFAVSAHGLYFILGADSKPFPDTTIDEAIVDQDGDLPTLILTPAQAYAIDTMTDDGNPNTGNTGSFWLYGGDFGNCSSGAPTIACQLNNIANNCANSDTYGDVAAEYVLTNEENACMLYVKAAVK